MKSLRIAASLIAITSACALPLSAKIVGTNIGADGLTAERVAALPDGKRTAWAIYLDRSWAQMIADRSELAAEWNGALPPPGMPAPVGQSLNIPLDQPASWYAGSEGRHRANTIVSFQTPAGGWAKNQNRAGPPRRAGQPYANNSENMEKDPSDFDSPRDRFWTFVGTLDNGATTSEMRFLARVAAAVPGPEGDVYRASFLKGVRYLLAAQYPNGGWPQVWPLEGGYHDAVTFNDDAVSQAAMLLDEVGQGRGDFAFVPAELRAAAAASAARAVDVILAAQIRVGGQLTCWPQQVDPLTLAPTSARNYEMRSIASGESTDIMLFLMSRRDPSPRLRAAVDACAAWLNAHKVRDLAFTETPDGRKSIYEKGAVTWARNYDIATGLPIFGDRDKSIHDTVNDLSRERRDNYSWYGSVPQKAIARYGQWKN